MENPSYIIGITGGSGSGKTTFIKQLREAFTEEQLCVLSQDDYYRPREQQILDKAGIRNFDLPTSILEDELLRDIKLLRQGQTVSRQEYTFNNEKATPGWLNFRPAPILIVEGLFVFHFREIFQLLDLRIFLDAKENLKVIRRIKRDRVERNYPLDDVLYRYENHVMPTYERYIAPYKHQADIIINNNEHFLRGMDVVKGFIQNRLHPSSSI